MSKLIADKHTQESRVFFFLKFDRSLALLLAIALHTRPVGAERTIVPDSLLDYPIFGRRAELHA